MNEMTFEEIEKAQERERIILSFNNKMNALVKDYPDREQQTWYVQIAEAEALVADSNVETPMIDSMVNGGDRLALAEKILAKSKQYKVACGMLLAEKNSRLAELEMT